MQGTAESAKALVEKVAVIAEVHIQRRFLMHGLTDAVSFSIAGPCATTLIRTTKEGYLDHLHVPSDNPESIAEENLQEALEVCLKTVEI